MADRLDETALGGIQGFLTSGYGHLPLARYLFLHIRDADGAREYLDLLRPHITTAASWPKVDGRKVKPTRAINVAVTADGLEALKVPEEVRCTFPAEFQEGLASAERSAILGDTGGSAPAHWELGGPAQPPIHLAVVIHGESPTALDRACEEHGEVLARAAGALSAVEQHPQEGYRPAHDHEPFGFHDGIAQPSIRGITGRGVPTGEFILGYENHYGVIAPGPVVPDGIEGSAHLPALANPHHRTRGLRDLGRHGSFVVYRKLLQRVAAFWQFIQAEAVRATGGADAAYMLWLAARMMGRWPNGAPLAKAPDRDDPRLRQDDEFLYDDDVDGLRCPMGAHIRRTNPRAVLRPYGVAQSLSMAEAHRMLRRARVFGPPLVDAAALQDSSADGAGRALVDLEDDGVERGIHFFCVNASIRSQFEFVQQSWCNNPRFGGLTNNKDPIIGDNAPDGPASHMEIPRRPVARRTAALPRFVVVKGGAYLFMPGLAALRFLSAPLARR
jgi:Dyp-type peroxidase family